MYLKTRFLVYKWPPTMTFVRVLYKGQVLKSGIVQGDWVAFGQKIWPAATELPSCRKYVARVR